MFSSVSFGEWTKVGESVTGDTFYVDLERMRIHDGYRYIWDLNDSLEPNEWGYLSSKTYRQVDCKKFKIKFLQLIVYEQPMGEGSGKTIPGDKVWSYPSPNSIDETIVKKVCER